MRHSSLYFMRICFLTTHTDPTAHAAALSRVLGLGQPRLMALVHRCPDLFRFSPQALAATLEALAELTGLQVVQVPQLVSADPHLLLRPDRLKTNMRELAQVPSGSRDREEG
ncbi:hypothetical protein Vretifemale_11663, partial [Volvox reticuliferus]